jgi:beta-lactam-binding protein with PASTA domain
MRECVSCGRRSEPDRDFCPCGEYLRWELTGATPLLAAPPIDAAPAPTAARRPAPASRPTAPAATPLMSHAVPAADVALTLMTETDDAWLADPAFTVDPGAAVSFRARIRNQRDTVAHFSVRVEGIPEAWWSVAPPTLFLMPYGSDGPCEGEVVVTLHPPRTPDAEAREWPLRVLATSRGSEVARVTAALTITAYHEIETGVTPERRRGRRRARFRFDVRNDGNAVARLAISARDDAEHCRFVIAGPLVELRPGVTAQRVVSVKPRRPIILGRPEEHAIELAAEVLETGAQALPRRISWSQRAWLPSWLKWLVPLVAVAVAALILMHVRVPAVRGLPVDAAERKLDAAHLSWKPPVQRRSKRPVGSVLASIPPAGASRWRGAQVTLIVATNNATAKVPKVEGERYAQAVVALVKAGFRTDTTAPTGGADTKVAAQIPVAGTRWPRSRPVELTFVGRKPAHGRKRAHGRPTAKVAVPALAGATVPEALNALRHAGLRPHVTRDISVKPAGTLLGIQPATGKLAKGARVEVRVSAGFPQLVADDGHRISILDGIAGDRRQRLRLGGEGGQTQAAWTPDGQRLVYRSGSSDDGRIWISDRTRTPTGVPRGGRPLTGRGSDDRRPAVSPDGKVVAFVRGRSRLAAHRLCLVPTAGGRASCLPALAGSVSRPVWSPAGTDLLITTVDGKLLRLASKRASAGTAGAWRSKGALPIDQLGAVESIAWSVTGELAMAVIPPIGQRVTAFRAHDAGLGKLQPINFAGLACELSWRPDGKELVIAARVDDDGRSCPDTLGRDGGAATRLPPDGSANVALGDRIVNPAFRPLALGG